METALHASIEQEEMNLQDKQLKLKLKTKVSYGMGNLAANLLLTTANAFISYFYTENVGIAAATVGIILMVGRILDGIADIGMGILVDHTKSSKGKARPWLLRMAVPYVLALVLLFSTPDFGAQGNVIYALASYLFAMFIYTGVNVPYNTLMAMQTQSQKERTSLSAFRTAIGFIGAVAVNAMTIPLVQALGGGSHGWMMMGILYGIVGAILYVNVYLHCKEEAGAVAQVAAESAKKASSVPLMASFKSLLTNKYWLLVIFMGIIGNLNAGLSGVNVYYAQYILGSPELVGVIGIASFVPIIVGVLVSGPLVVKFGKCRVSMIGAALQLIGCIPMALASSSLPVILAGLVIRGLGAAPMLIASMAMICDTVEYGEWRTGIRNEGLTFSAQSFSEKVGAGLGGVVVGAILGLGGYIGGQAVQLFCVLASEFQLAG